MQTCLYHDLTRIHLRTCEIAGLALWPRPLLTSSHWSSPPCFVLLSPYIVFTHSLSLSLSLNLQKLPPLSLYFVHIAIPLCLCLCRFLYLSSFLWNCLQSCNIKFSYLFINRSLRIARLSWGRGRHQVHLFSFSLFISLVEVWILLLRGDFRL